MFKRNLKEERSTKTKWNIQTWVWGIKETVVCSIIWQFYPNPESYVTQAYTCSKVHDSGVSSTWGSTASPKPVQCLPMASTAYLKFSILYSLWTRIQTPGKPVRQTRNTTKNSLVIETTWFKTTDFIVATCPAMRYENASTVQSFQWSLPFDKHYFSEL